MEKEISELKELDENEIAQMIYEKIDVLWGKFKNIWNFVTKDDMATQVAMDLYRPRKEDGVPHIIHYYNTKGERSLKPLIGMIAYNVLVAEARDIYSTGVFNNELRRNIYSPLSLEKKIYKSDEEITLGDTIEDRNVDLFSDVNYTMLLEKLPNKIVDNVFYLIDNKYKPVTYKSILHYLLEGYNLTQIGENMYKKSRQGKMVNYRDVSALVKEVKQVMKQYLESEYNYTEESYAKGWSL